MIIANDIARYAYDNGLDDEQMAALMSTRLGRDITVRGYKQMARRKNPPRKWLEALDIAPSADEGAGQHGREFDGPPIGDDSADVPRARPEAKPLSPVLPFEPQSAHMTITLLYTAAGKGAALGLRSPQVADVWAQMAPQIASSYIEWARENATVAKIIGTLTLGGAGGQCILLHGTLIVQTLIISGQVRPEQFIPPPRSADPTDILGDNPPVAEGVNNGNSDGGETRSPRKTSRTR